MSFKLSIIIPCFNAVRYIDDLLDSLAPQICSEVEVVLVDDCSTDDTIRSLKKFASDNINVLVIRSINNKGIGASRNIGLESSSGEYIWFVDSDDCVEENSVRLILENIDSSSGDMHCYSYEIMNSINEKKTVHNFFEGECDKDSFFKSVLDKKMTFHLWNKIISRKFIGDIRSNERISVLVDMNFFLELVDGRSLKMILYNDCIYKYFLRKGSTITKLTEVKLRDQQFTFGLFVEQLKKTKIEKIDTFILIEKIRNSYQITKNRGVVVTKLPGLVNVFNREVSMFDKCKLIYAHFYFYLMSNKIDC